MITTHPAYPRLKELAEERKSNIHQGVFDIPLLVRSRSRSPPVLAEELERLRGEAKAENWTELTKDIHFYPDLHGKPGISLFLHSLA